MLRDDEELSRCEHLAEAVSLINEWDLVLFLEPTVDFVQDGTRSEVIAENREKYSNQIKELLDKYSVTYHSLGGDYLERFMNSKKLIADELKIDTQW